MSTETFVTSSDFLEPPHVDGQDTLATADSGIRKIVIVLGGRDEAGIDGALKRFIEEAALLVGNDRKVTYEVFTAPRQVRHEMKIYGRKS